MIQSLWTFVIASILLWSLFYLRPPWTLENVIIGGVPLLFLVIFGYRFWRAKREQRQMPPDDGDDA